MLLRKAAALVLAASAAIACVIYEYTIKARTNGGNFRIPIYQRDVDFQWGTTKVRGVNIGGWLLLEPYVTFDGSSNSSIGLTSDTQLDYTVNLSSPRWKRGRRVHLVRKGRQRK